MEHIRQSLTINAPIARVFEAISTQKGLSKWWTTETTAKAEIGFLNEFKFGEHHCKEMRVTHLETDKLVRWVCEGGDEEWINTSLSFSLESKDEKTALRFAHRDWKEATEYYESCNYHWGYFMHSLKQLCETGTGTPF